MTERAAYTVAEVAALTGFSRSTVIRMFEREHGVLILGRPESMHKRGYRSIRIPRVVYYAVPHVPVTSESSRSCRPQSHSLAGCQRLPKGICGGSK